MPDDSERSSSKATKGFSAQPRGRARVSVLPVAHDGRPILLVLFMDMSSGPQENLCLWALALACFRTWRGVQKPATGLTGILLAT